MTFKDKPCEGCTGVKNFCCLPLSGCPCVNCLLKSICELSCSSYDVYLLIIQSRDKKSRKIRVVKIGSRSDIQKSYLLDARDLVELKRKKLEESIP